MTRYDDPAGRRRPRRPRLATSPLLLVVAGLVVAGPVVAFFTPAVLPGVLNDARSRVPWFPEPGCAVTVIEVVAPPEVVGAVRTAVAGVRGRKLPDGTCAQVRVRDQVPSDTVGGSEVLPPGRAPHVWISDSSLWAGRVRSWRLTGAGSFGSTPVVLVTNPATRAASGWGTAAPSWLAALDGTHPLAVPELETNSAGMLGMQALWQVGGKKAPAERRLAAALLRSGRSAVPTEGEALRAVAKGATGQPLVVTSERAMLAVNAASARPDLVAVFPSEGSPALDYPVYRVAPEARTASQGAGVDAVVAALTGAEGLAAARAAYLRSPDGSAPPAGAGGRVVRMPSPGAVEQGRFLVRLASIAKPSRVLVVVDVSESMRAAVPGTGLSRVQVAGKAAATAGDLLTDASSVGLWVFAVNLDGGAPYAKVAAVRPLGTALGGRTHRQVLVSSLLGLDERLAPGGTGLYRTARDAVRAAREEFDPRAVNTVVLMTDGTDEFGGGLTREQLVRTLTVEAGSAPDRPVRLVGIGIGPSADLGALRAMVAPTGGKAYRAETPAELRQVLLDVLARRG